MVDVNSNNDTTFATKDIFEKRGMFNSSFKASKSWKDADLRTYLNTTGFYNLLPSNIQSAIKSKTADYYLAAYGHMAGSVEGDAYESVTDKIWLPRLEEVGRWNDSYKYRLSGEVLKYYNDNPASLTREIAWWLSSASNYSNSTYVYFKACAKSSTPETPNTNYARNAALTDIGVVPHYTIGGT